MKTILYKKGKTGKTALAMRKQLGCYSNRSFGSHSFTTRKGNYVTRQRNSYDSISKLIRWGSSEQPELRCETLNSTEGIELSSNKLKALKALKEAGVSVPWFTVQKQDVIDKTESTGLYVGRTTYHQGGSGFNIIKNITELLDDNQSSHWLELINVYKEYRVHVFQGEVIGVSRKTDEGVEDRIVNRYTRNHHNGWRFIRCDVNEVQQRLKDLGIEAVKALGLDFGAVDIILSDGSESTSNGGKHYYVLEVNTAPGMEKESSIFQEYIRRFKQWLQ